MFGAIDANILLEIARKEGAYYQLELLETIPEYEIEEQYLTSIFNGWKCPINEYGKASGVTSSIDHPAFTSLREVLGRRGYVEIQRQWCNGDRVKKEFKLNGKTFKEGDQFSSAGAMKHILNIGK